MQDVWQEFRLEGALYAGDDFADLDAFAALDRLSTGVSIKVAVSGPETPEGLIEAADMVVEGPRALVPLLREL